MVIPEKLQRCNGTKLRVRITGYSVYGMKIKRHDKSVFNANYIDTNAFYPKAYYAQPRGSFRR